VEQRRNAEDYKDPSKQLKRIFRTSKEKEKLQDTSKWEFSQDEVDKALSAVIENQSSTPGLIQAFLSLGAKVNYIDTTDDKKTKSAKQPNASARRRSTVLQRAATFRRADSVGLLASSGADQTTLDEALKAALAENDQSCIQELLRHGADINKFPNSLADAVRSSDQNLVRLLLRAPKAYRPEIVSSCLPAAVQQKSEPILSMLIGYGADPNFNGASGLVQAVTTQQYRLAVALVAGPVKPTPESLQQALEPAMKMSTVQELHQYFQLLLCCGLPPGDQRLPGLLVTACKRNDTRLAQLLIDHGVLTAFNGAECLKSAMLNANWELLDSILQRPLSAAHASAALPLIPHDAPKSERLRVIGSLLQKGANGPALGKLLVRAVEDGDSPLMDLLLHAGAPLESGNSRALQLAIIRKDKQALSRLLSAKLSPGALAQSFSLLREGYSAPERLDVARLLLNHGARGAEVDVALIDAVGDTSASRDVALITELVRHGVNVNHDNGKVFQLAASQADMPILQLLCKSKPFRQSTSSALPAAFRPDGSRHPMSLNIIELLISHGVEQRHALTALDLAVNGGPSNIDIIDRLVKSDPSLVVPAFEDAIALESSRMKAPIINHLLKIGIRQEVLGEALISETKRVVADEDPYILRMLLQYGASVNHNSGESLGIAVASVSTAAMKILLGGKEAPTRNTVTKAFRALLKDINSPNGASDQEMIAIARELLGRGVEQSAIDLTLRTVLDETCIVNDYRSFVQLLLEHNADVNTGDGVCFVSAARRADFDLFETMLARKVDFKVLIPTLVMSHLEVQHLVRILQLCFEHGAAPEDLEQGHYGVHFEPALVLAMRQYPRSEALIQVFLGHGCNADINVLSIVDPDCGEETVSALLWAMAQPQKMVSSSVILALLSAGASPTRPAPTSEVSPIALAARESRQDLVQELLARGADPSVRDSRNRSALFYASSSPVTSVVQSLSAHALKDDGSLHEAARCLHLDIAKILIGQGHSPNFPSRLHSGRSALGELCLNAEATTGAQRTRARQLIRLFLDNGANPKFKARNERSAVILALDNPYSALEITEALLDTEVWEELNNEKHMFRDSSGLWYSPIKYVELVPSPSRSVHKHELVELLRDKGCEPKYYSEHPEQPQNAIGMPPAVAKLADRQKEHLLSLKIAKEANDHARMLEEAAHRDTLRRKQEQKEAEMTAAAQSQAQWQSLEQSKHEFEMQRVRSAERMKRNEKVAWHNLQKEQERDFAAQRQQIEDRKASATYAHEAKLIQQRQAEVEHRAGVERKALLEKEQLFDRNVTRQKQLTDRLDESAQLHARLRQDRPAIEPANWGSVD
jgi:ankyrin repeat protein